jgi:hypothetical protein
MEKADDEGFDIKTTIATVLADAIGFPANSLER